MINQLFHKYGTYKQFNQNLVGGLIHKDAICFIEETRQIYAQGKLYAVSIKDFQKYEEVIQTHQKKLENIQERLVAFSKEIDDFVGNVNNKLDSYKKNIDTVDNLYNSMSTKYNELNLSFTELNEAVFVYKGIVDNLRKQHETFETNTNQNFNNQGTRLTSIERAIEAIDVRFQQITDKYTEVKTYIQEVQAAEIETRQKVNALELSKGEANGLATLDESGHVPSYQLPAYVDDILEFSSKEFFPEEGVSGKLYLDKFENKTYRWTGTQYTEISNSLALGETSSTAYPGNRGKMISDYLTAHMADNNNPHNVNKQQLGLENVDNTSDVDKPMSTVTKAAVDEINEGMEIMANMLEERLDHLTRNLDAINEELNNKIENFPIDDKLSKTSENPVQNKEITMTFERLGENLDNLKTILDTGEEEFDWLKDNFENLKKIINEHKVYVVDSITPNVEGGIYGTFTLSDLNAPYLVKHVLYKVEPDKGGVLGTFYFDINVTNAALSKIKGNTVQNIDIEVSTLNQAQLENTNTIIIKMNDEILFKVSLNGINPNFGCQLRVLVVNNEPYFSLDNLVNAYVSYNYIGEIEIPQE